MSFKESVEFFLIFVTFVGIIIGFIFTSHTLEYEYVDLNDNKGIGRFCSERDMTCTRTDDKIVKVKEFKAVK